MEILTGKPLPHAYRSFMSGWRRRAYTQTRAYEKGDTSFIEGLLPETAVKYTVYQTLDVLYKKLGADTFFIALNPASTIDSPLKNHENGNWLKTTNMVGVNVRTIGTFWNVVNYAFTLPKSQECIHLLPIWEPGVVGSLYGKVSWNINQEFFNHELAQIYPHLDTVEKQLKVVINLLHALGKSVGLDVIPHTDRFSEIVIKHPRMFEWVKRHDTKIVSQSESLYKKVEQIIWQYLEQNGTANGHLLPNFEALFDPDNETFADWQRQEIIFGQSWDRQKRLARRIDLIQLIVNKGFETLPMTMGPPYRGLHIKPNDFVTDERGLRWYQYDFNKPQSMSRVFGPLVRYKMYHTKDDNANWELDFEKPNLPTWNYLKRQYAHCQAAYNFDFMRGDMAHVQMRPAGVPTEICPYYDPLRAVKIHINKLGVKHFAFYAETFLAPPNEMGYGNEADHLEAIEAEATLGDLQASVVGSDDFMKKFADYDQLLRSRKFAPSFTIITADKDDPRFDEFYKSGNVLRYFIGTFLTDMTSYMGLGFEVRNQHLQRGKNEEYSKLYVFQIHNDAEADKVTHGPFLWGKNVEQFKAIGRIRNFAEQNWNELKDQPIEWLLSPDASAKNKVIAWTLSNRQDYVFIANLDTQHTTLIPKKIRDYLTGYNYCFDTLQIENQIISERILPAQGLIFRKK